MFKSGAVPRSLVTSLLYRYRVRENFILGHLDQSDFSISYNRSHSYNYDLVQYSVWPKCGDKLQQGVGLGKGCQNCYVLDQLQVC